MSAGRVCLVSLVLASLVVTSCSRRSLVRQYEYEEEIVLSLSGSATVTVNASIPALVALRALPLDPAPRSRFDRATARDWFASPATRVTRVSRPWRRAGRRFVQIRLQVDDVGRLSEAPAFAGSLYRFGIEDEAVVYRQVAGTPAGARPPGVNWNGSEIAAVRIHVPSRIQFHNAPSREVERGNILVWEQPLVERMAGHPLDVEVRMDRQSILIRTLTVFAVAVGAAIAVMAAVIWWVVRKGRGSQASS
jgi:hypothetical protein